MMMACCVVSDDDACGGMRNEQHRGRRDAILDQCGCQAAGGRHLHSNPALPDFVCMCSIFPSYSFIFVFLSFSFFVFALGFEIGL